MDIQPMKLWKFTESVEIAALAASLLVMQGSSAKPLLDPVTPILVASSSPTYRNSCMEFVAMIRNPEAHPPESDLLLIRIKARDFYMVLGTVARRYPAAEQTRLLQHGSVLLDEAAAHVRKFPVSEERDRTLEKLAGYKDKTLAQTAGLSR